MTEVARNYHIATGAVHVHTTDSDGTKTHEEVAAIAESVGLDFVLFADHMTLQSYHDGKENYYGSVLALIGYEHNDADDCNHYLIFNSDEVLPSSMTASEYVEAAAANGALGILAHPDEIRGRDARFRSYPWTDWSVERFDGIELWNQMSEWMENLKFYNQIRMVVSPRRFLQGPTARVLKKWDELSVRRPIVGVASVDAHGFLYRAGLLRLTIFPYKVQFKSLRTHLLLNEPLSKEFAAAKKQVYEALKACRVFISNYRWGQADAFRFEIGDDREAVSIGGSACLRPGLKARVESPQSGRIQLIHNGREIASGVTRVFEQPISEPGLYRVEVHHGRKGWIFSNHIRVQQAP